MITHYYLWGTDANGKPIVPESVYKTAAEYQEFYERYQAAVLPALEKYRIAHAQSEHASRSRWIGNPGGRRV